MFLTNKQWLKLGAKHKAEGFAHPIYPGNEWYMIGFTSGKPIVVRRMS